jgi:hypothetical protein
MKKFLTIMSLLTVIATVAFSATAQSSWQLYMFAPVVPSAARDAAIHECSVKAGKWSMIGKPLNSRCTGHAWLNMASSYNLALDASAHGPKPKCCDVRDLVAMGGKRT